MARTLAFFRFILILAPLVGPWFVFGRARNLPAVLLNADAIFAFNLFDDLFANGGALSAWSFPPPGFFVPDLAVAFALAATGLEVVPAVFLYGWLQFAALYAGILFLMRGIEGADHLAGAVAGAFTVLAICADSVTPGAFTVFALTHHTGAFVLAVWAAGFFMRGSYGWTALFSAVGTCSDPLFIGFFVLPALCATACAPITGKQNTPGRARHLALLIAGAIFGRLIFMLIRSADWFLLPDPFVPSAWNVLFAPERWPALLAGTWGDLAAGPPVAMILIAGIVALCVTLFARREDARSTWFAAFCVFSVAACLAMGMAGALLLDQSELAARYLLPALCWPVFSFFIFISNISEFVGRLVAALAAVWFFAGTGGPVLPGPEFLHYRHPVALCLEREVAARDGLAAYSLAKPVDLFRRRSGSVFRINQIDETGRPYFWMSSAAWFDPPDSLPHYNFILTGGLNEGELEKRFGPPARRLSCPGTAVWMYDRPLPFPSPGEIRIWRALIGR